MEKKPLNKTFVPDPRWDISHLNLPKRTEKLISSAQDALRDMQIDLIEAAHQRDISLSKTEPKFYKCFDLIERYINVKDNIRILDNERSRIKFMKGGYKEEDKRNLNKAIDMAITLTRRELDTFIEHYIDEVGITLKDLHWITSIIDDDDPESLFTRLNIVYKTLKDFLMGHCRYVAGLEADREKKA